MIGRHPREKPHHELGRLVAQARRRVWTAAARALEAQGDSMLTWQLLARLRTGGARTQKELADATAQHPAGVSRLLAELEERKLVRRRRDAGDRRRVVVAITAAGGRWWARRRPVVHAAIGGVVAVLSDAEQATLAGLLRKLVDDRT